jgi:peptide chain release factor subunit 1
MARGAAQPELRTDEAVREAVERLAAVLPGAAPVVSCYLKLEPRDKTRGKYLIKMKNRLKEVAADLARRPLERKGREAAIADLERIRHFFEEPARLPAARGVALFASGPLGLFEAIPLPQVHRSRLVVAPSPLIRELAALDEEFGTILVAACDRTAARFFVVTAYDIVELPALASAATRPSRFHGPAQVRSRSGTPGGSAGEHNYHQRIRREKQRLYADAADRIYQIHTQRPLTGLVVAGIGVDAAALVPHLHSYVHDLVLGVVKLNPKKVTPAEVREAALTLREERERAWERAHAEAMREGLASGWAVNGVEPSLRALRHGQVRTLLADGHDEDTRIDDAVEEALGQRAQVDVLYDADARRAVDGLGALLRFRG